MLTIQFAFTLKSLIFTTFHKVFKNNRLEYIEDINGITLDPGEITSGVPQGSTLGPLLII